MPIKVRVPPAITRGSKGSDTVEVAAQNLPELLTALEGLYPGVKKTICDDAGKLNRFVNVFVNDEDIRFLGGEGYHFQDGDEVLLIPSIAGGADWDKQIAADFSEGGSGTPLLERWDAEIKAGGAVALEEFLSQQVARC